MADFTGVTDQDLLAAFRLAEALVEEVNFYRTADEVELGAPDHRRLAVCLVEMERRGLVPPDALDLTRAEWVTLRDLVLRSRPTARTVPPEVLEGLRRKGAIVYERERFGRTVAKASLIGMREVLRRTAYTKVLASL